MFPILKKALTPLLLLFLLTGNEATAQHPGDRFDPENPDMAYLVSLVDHKINAYREKKRIPGLSLEEDLNSAAGLHADYLKKKGKLDHFQNKAAFKTPVERVAHYNPTYKSVGENIAYVATANIRIRDGEKEILYKTYGEMSEELVSNWIQSKPHHKNIVDKGYTRTGISMAYDPVKSRIYSVQVFAAK